MPVHFIGEEDSGYCRIKIGVAKDIEKRRNNLQTGNRSAIRLLGWIITEETFELERRLHHHFAATRVRGEWFAIEPADILPILMRSTSDGFVAKNADAFEIVGYATTRSGAGQTSSALPPSMDQGIARQSAPTVRDEDRCQRGPQDMGCPPGIGINKKLDHQRHYQQADCR